jgi:hypothetical protein
MNQKRADLPANPQSLNSAQAIREFLCPGLVPMEPAQAAILNEFTHRLNTDERYSRLVHLGVLSRYDYTFTVFHPAAADETDDYLSPQQRVDEVAQILANIALRVMKKQGEPNETECAS